MTGDGVDGSVTHAWLDLFSGAAVADSMLLLYRAGEKMLIDAAICLQGVVRIVAFFFRISGRKSGFGSR